MAIKRHLVNSIQPTVNFIIPTYNSGGSLIRCLKSIRDQDEQDWRAIVIDDASTDDSLEHASQFFVADERIELITNPKNLGACYSRYRGIHHISQHPDDICFLLDGDDWLLGSRALGIIKEAYKNGAEATHGSYVAIDGSTPKHGHYSVDVQKAQSYRSVKWKVQPPRTFKYKYFRYLPTSQFRDEQGDWIKACTDLAIMFPVLEQIPFPGFHFIPETIYRYDNELRNLKRLGNDYKSRMNSLIRNKNLELVRQ